MSSYFLYRNCWRFEGAPHQERKVSQDDVRFYLKRGGYFLRNTFDFDCEKETPFWYIIKDGFGGMDELSRNVRNKVRKADKTLDFKIVDKQFIFEKGYKIYNEVLKSYPVKDRNVSEKEFLEYLNHSGTECWIGVDKNNGEVACFAINYVWNDVCQYEITAVLPKYRRNSPYTYYGLFYEMNENYLEKRHFRYVSDGSRTITEHSTVQDYLIKNFGFRKAYCHLRVYYQWWFKLTVKLLLPFRNVIPSISVQAVLRMESIQKADKSGE